MTIKNADGNIYLTERAAADADIAGDGQLWVENTTPNKLKFTDDAGTDFNIATENKALTTLATEQATTSGTSIDFTGIPSGVKRIEVMFSAVSTNGGSDLLIQIGDSGGFEATGYSGYVFNTNTEAMSGEGFDIAVSNNASAAVNGSVTLILEDSAAFTWVSSGTTSDAAQTALSISSGIKSLTAELTQIRLTTAAGTDTFDAGSINIQYSF